MFSIQNAVEILAAKTALGDREAAARVLARLSAQDRSDLAIEQLIAQGRAVVRARTLAAEQRAEEKARQRRIAQFRSPVAAAERSSRAAAEDAKYDRLRAEGQAEIRNALDAYALSRVIEWTAELLDSTFAMPDGKRVTWGEATLAQHSTRANMFATNVLVNAEGAARHRLAIVALTTSGKASLRAAVEQEAA